MGIGVIAADWDVWLGCGFHVIVGPRGHTLARRGGGGGDGAMGAGGGPWRVMGMVTAGKGGGRGRLREGNGADN